MWFRESSLIPRPCSLIHCQESAAWDIHTNPHSYFTSALLSIHELEASNEPDRQQTSLIFGFFVVVVFFCCFFFFVLSFFFSFFLIVWSNKKTKKRRKKKPNEPHCCQENWTGIFRLGSCTEDVGLLFLGLTWPKTRRIQIQTMRATENRRCCEENTPQTGKSLCYLLFFKRVTINRIFNSIFHLCVCVYMCVWSIYFLFQINK